jgi:hypothetical protein
MLLTLSNERSQIGALTRLGDIRRRDWIWRLVVNKYTVKKLCLPRYHARPRAGFAGPVRIKSTTFKSLYLSCSDAESYSAKVRVALSVNLGAALSCILQALIGSIIVSVVSHDTSPRPSTAATVNLGVVLNAWLIS